MNRSITWPRQIFCSTFYRRVLSHRIAVCAIAALALGGCATPGPTNETAELDFERAVTVATDGLVAQTQKLPAFLAKVEAKINKKDVVIDPMLDAASGQQTGGTRLLEQRVSERMRKVYTQFEILPFQSGNVGKAQYLLTGTLTRIISARSGARNPFQIN